MMSSLGGFHHAALSVTDLYVIAAWYATVLGLEERFREQSETRQVIVFGFPGGGSAVGLVCHHGSASTFDPTVIGLDHLAFTVPTHEELEEWAERLDRQGVVHSGVIDTPAGGILNFKDPDGIALSLFWDR